METLALKIVKMADSYCVTAVVNRLSELQEVFIRQAIPGSLLLEYDSRMNDKEKIRQVIESLGYKTIEVPA
jgi:hypothetical protein